VRLCACVCEYASVSLCVCTKCVSVYVSTCVRVFVCVFTSVSVCICARRYEE